MKTRFLVLVAVLSVIFAFGSAPSTQTRPTTVLWDQPNTIPVNTYVLLLDGARIPLTATCVGTTFPKQCSAPLPIIDMSVSHEIVVLAANEWGEAGSVPLRFGRPVAPQGVAVR